MTTVLSTTAPVPPSPTDWTLADLMDRFGPVLLRRLRAVPSPGEATEQDVTEIYAREKRLYELVDRVLVEKAVGFLEACLAAVIIKLLGYYNDEAGLGLVAGPDGMTKLAPGLIRIPDVSFVSWDRLSGRAAPNGAFLEGSPDLAVEVLSPGNTTREMSVKLDDYFRTGVRLVWYIEPAAKTVEVFTARDRSTVLKEGDTLDGGDVLPGFGVPVARLFEGLAPKPAR